jgi:hypothetical protein
MSTLKLLILVLITLEFFISILVLPRTLHQPLVLLHLFVDFRAGELAAIASAGRIGILSWLEPVDALAE